MDNRFVGNLKYLRLTLDTKFSIIFYIDNIGEKTSRLITVLQR